MFVFYDLETSGTSPAFDQPLQFAAILTGGDLNEIERIDFRCRLSPHILPAPWALAVTGVTPDTLTDPSLPTAFEFSQQIGRLIETWGPATWVGYNNIAFDEEVMRQMFYQNLHPNPYLTQMDGNDRLDVIKLVYATWVFANDTLNWATNENGNTIFKLDQLAPANGFSNHNAHDALGDVEATIHIARLIRDRAPQVWEQSLRNRSKESVRGMMQNGEVLALVERFGAAPPRAFWGAYAGQNPKNANALAFMDLEQADPKELSQAGSDAVADAVSASPMLVRTVTINKAPNIFKVTDVEQKLQQRADDLMEMPKLHAAIGAALAERYAECSEPEHVEQQIYSGFYSRDDKRKLSQFQHASWEQRLDIARSFEDRRLRWLGSRLICLNKPDLLTATARERWAKLQHHRWLSNDSNAPWMTTANVSGQLAEIAEQGAVSVGTLDQLRAYYKNLI